MKPAFNPYSTQSRTEALEMDKDFTRNEHVLAEKDTPTTKYLHRGLIKVLKPIYNRRKPFRYISSDILDIGERNPLTERMEDALKVKIDNTWGNLDYELNAPKNKYGIIVFSHVIEHLFNPLFCLDHIRYKMNPDSVLIIACPIKPHYIKWGSGHYHEMDEYRFRKLVEAAGFKISVWYKLGRRYNLKTFFKSIFGVRPLIHFMTRLIFYRKVHSIVILTQQP